MIGGSYRSVVKQPRFEREAAAIQPDVRRMDDALRYVENQVARFPTSGIQSCVPGIWVAPVRVPADSTIVRASVFYTFNESYVWFQSIRRAP